MDRSLRATETTRPEVGLDPGHDHAVHPSPVLEEIFRTLSGDNPIRVLDLGPAIPENLERLSSLGGGVRIAHLLRIGDPDPNGSRTAGGLESLLRRRVPLDEPPYGLILAWDLLNYLGPAATSALVGHLTEVSRIGCLLHAMTYTSETMPTRPSAFHLVDDNRLAYRPTSAFRRPVTDPPPTSVERRLLPFQVARAVILRHGVREVLAALNS